MIKIETLLSWAEVEWWIARSGDEGLIGARVREWREARDPRLSQDKMAADFSAYVVVNNRPRYRISKATLVRLEAGQRKVTSTEAVLLTRFFGKTLPELLLPSADVSDIEDLKLFDEASLALASVREAMYQYVRSQERLRARVERNPRLRALIEAREREAKSRHDDIGLDNRERVARTAEILSERGAKAQDIPAESEWLEQSEPTPEDVTARHALSKRTLSDDGWHRELTWDANRAKSDWRARSQTSPRRNRGTQKGEEHDAK